MTHEQETPMILGATANQPANASAARRAQCANGPHDLPHDRRRAQRSQPHALRALRRRREGWLPAKGCPASWPRARSLSRLTMPRSPQRSPIVRRRTHAPLSPTFARRWLGATSAIGFYKRGETPMCDAGSSKKNWLRCSPEHRGRPSSPRTTPVTSFGFKAT